MTTLQIAHEAMEYILAGDAPILAALRVQYQSAAIASVEMTGVGGYVNLNVPEASINLPTEYSFPIGGVMGDSECLGHGAGFLLWVRNGALDCLEFYTYDVPWPEEVDGIRLRYIGGRRDLSSLPSVDL